MIRIILLAFLISAELIFGWNNIINNNAFWKNSFASHRIPKLSYFLSSSKHLSQEKTALEKTIIIVGAGVGGLSVASRIASSSKSSASTPTKVLVLEKNSEGGGRCGSNYVTIPNVGTFRHERGPSLLLLPHIYRELFKDCGNSTPEDYGLIMTPCIPAYKVIFSDGETIDMGFPASSSAVDEELSSRQKLDSIEPNGAQKWDEYMDAMGAFLNCGLPNFIQEKLELSSLPSFLYQALKDGGKFWPLRAHSNSLDAAFRSTKLKALASFQDLYVGLEPYRNNNEIFGGVIKKTAPTVFGLLSALELHPTNEYAGVFAPMGGFQSVYYAFKRLAESNGVEIRYNTTVTKVCSNGVYCRDTYNGTYNRNQSTGIATWIPSDLVVVNADLPYATNSLLEKEKDAIGTDDSKIIYDWDDTFDFSSGVIAFHWCINRCLNELNTHNVFLCSDNTTMAKQSWEVLRTAPTTTTLDCMEKQQQALIPKDNDDRPMDEQNHKPFNFYVHRPCRSDPSAAPDGFESLTILVPCQPLIHIAEGRTLGKVESMKVYRKQFNDERVSRIREAVLTRLSVLKGVGNLKDSILHESVDTPASYADMYNLGAGAPFGLSHGFGQLSITRPSAEVKGLENVLMVGASSRPGNGVPLVLIGAKLVWEKIQKKLFL